MKPTAIIGCERSGVVRRAMRERGIDAWSCDIESADDGDRHHLQCDVRDRLNDGWDFGLFHPPCTYLCGMGIWWNHKRPERWPLTMEAAQFVKDLWAAPIPAVGLENPIGYLNRNWMKPTQIVNPWQFGDEAHKPTCLWLRGLPSLIPTQVVGRGRFYTKANGTRMSAWSHKCSGTRKADRARIAATTFPGIAAAMAAQWGDFLLSRVDRSEAA